MSRERRRGMVDRQHPALSTVRQCALLDISRSSLYYRPKGVLPGDLALMKLIDQPYLVTPFYGSRRIRVWLSRQGHQVSRKRVQRLMRTMGLQAIYRRPRTSQPAPGHKVYPYLLSGMEITRPNQVWAAIKEALQSPDLLNEEYERRLGDSGTTDSVEYERKQLAVARKRLEVQGNRVTDAYINEAMDLSRYKIEMEKLRGRRENLDRFAQELDDKANRELSSRDALEHLRRFCDQVSQGLDLMIFEERQQLLRLVVERITVVEERVTVETVIPTSGDDVKLRTRRGEPVEP